MIPTARYPVPTAPGETTEERRERWLALVREEIARSGGKTRGAVTRAAKRADVELTSFLERFGGKGTRVADVIERAEANGQNWRAAVADTGVDADAYLYRDRSEDAMLPWQIIDGGMKTAFFRQELEKSLRAEWTVKEARLA